MKNIDWLALAVPFGLLAIALGANPDLVAAGMFGSLGLCALSVVVGSYRRTWLIQRELSQWKGR